MNMEDNEQTDRKKDYDFFHDDRFYESKKYKKTSKDNLLKQFARLRRKEYDCSLLLTIL